MSHDKLAIQKRPSRNVLSWFLNFVGCPHMLCPMVTTTRSFRSAIPAALTSCLASSTSVPNTRSRYVHLPPSLVYRSIFAMRSTQLGSLYQVAIQYSKYLTLGHLRLDLAHPRHFLPDHQCWCSKTLPGYVTFGHNGCTSNCKGNSQEYCGGSEGRQRWFY